MWYLSRPSFTWTEFKILFDIYLDWVLFWSSANSYVSLSKPSWNPEGSLISAEFYLDRVFISTLFDVDPVWILKVSFISTEFYFE